MKDEKYGDIFHYKCAMNIAKKMMKSAIITEEEYALIEEKMSIKYRIDSRSIFRDNTEKSLDNNSVQS